MENSIRHTLCKLLNARHIPAIMVQFKYLLVPIQLEAELVLIIPTGYRNAHQ